MNYTPQELELCRHIAAIRARVPPPPLPPLAPLSPIQRIGYLKGEILCRESIGPFVAGGTYSARTLTVPAHSREQLLDGLGLHTQIELRSLETFVIIDGAAGGPHGFAPDDRRMSTSVPRLGDYQTLLRCFEIPDVPDLARLFPER